MTTWMALLSLSAAVIDRLAEVPSTERTTLGSCLFQQRPSPIVGCPAGQIRDRSTHPTPSHASEPVVHVFDVGSIFVACFDVLPTTHRSSFSDHCDM